MNTVNLIGRLTKEPELKYTPAGKAVVNFTLAINRPFKKQNGDNETDFIMIQAWGKTAENTANFLNKGSQAAVVGRIQTRNYENQQGQRVFVTEVVADNVQFLDPKNNGQGGQNAQGGQGQRNQGYNNQQGHNQQGYNQNQQKSHNQGNPGYNGQQQGYNQQNQGYGQGQPQGGYNQPPQNGNFNDPFANNGPIHVSDDELPF